MSQHQIEEPTTEQIEQLKIIVSEELTKYSSSILIDPECGLIASSARDKQAGLLFEYEKTGYDVNSTSRLPDCLAEWLVKRLKEQGADAVKFLIYYDVDSDKEINLQKKSILNVLEVNVELKIFLFFLKYYIMMKKIQIILV